MFVTEATDTHRPPRTLHIIPQDGIGGAEIAARSATTDFQSQVHVHAMFNGLFVGEGSIANPRLTGNPTQSAWSPVSLVGTLVRAQEIDPQVFIFSLWRTFGAFAALRLRYPDRKFVTFIHNERTANRVDAWLSGLMIRASDAIWVDSQATFDARLTSDSLRRRGRVISMMLERPTAPAKMVAAPNFVYWGRLARQKRLDRSISLFATIAANYPAARLTLIGPDHGERAGLEAQTAALGIADRVTFTGPAGRAAIETAAAQASFFFQLSEHEGMAMGVVEALQLGLVPVVTPVGQMAVYCRDSENAVVYRDADQAAARVAALLDDPAAFATASTAARATFAHTPTYSEDVSAAVRALVTGHG